MDLNEKKKKDHFEKTIKGFTYNIVGVILPFILSLLPIMLFGNYEAIVKFLDQGEFLLFSAGLYTTSFFLFGENSNSIIKRTDKILKNLSLWLLVICASLYAIVYCVDLFHTGINMYINLAFLRLFSLILFFVAVLSIYRSLHIDYLKTIPTIDVQKASKTEVEDIMNQLPN